MEITKEIDQLLKTKARCVSIKGQTWEDTFQDLRLAVLMAVYDSTKSSPRTFAGIVAKNKIRELIRQVSSPRRGGGINDVSIDEMLENGEI
jgi:DNA-directed RNA polymerase specialized sigma24 family protein